MRLVQGFLLLSFGLFSIAAQTMLFREFLTTFESNDIGVALFFGAWFIWVAVGAFLAIRWKAISEAFQKNIALLLLAYIPAFFLQWFLILHGRMLAGIQSYSLFSLGQMTFLSLFVNAPVSLITGLFFPIACRWTEERTDSGVSRVYILEAIGSFLGGFGVTLLLAYGVGMLILVWGISLFVALASLTLLIVQHKTFSTVLTGLMLIALVLCRLAHCDETLDQQVLHFKWSRLLPKETLEGSFRTAHAEYLYGSFKGQWIVVRQGSVCQALPDPESAGRIIAISLAQNPNARSVLIIGDGLEICRRLLLLNQINQVTWAHWDPQYVDQVERYMPDEWVITDTRMHRLKEDIRTRLAQSNQLYDLVILNMPDSTSSDLSRYVTCEFYTLLKQRLAPEGCLAVRISGGENIMGTELVNVGASAKETLTEVFSRLVIVPGEETWLIASDSLNLSDGPGMLRDRFASIPGGDKIFPAQALMSIYLPDRAQKARKAYESSDLPRELLINRDNRPLASLHALLLVIKQTGSPLTRLINNLSIVGPAFFIVPMAILLVLRVVYDFRSRQNNRKSLFDSLFLVFIAGWIGIGTVMILMFRYQTRFGSLYLHMGAISSLFMLGLTLGAAAARILVSHARIRPSGLLVPVILLHGSVLYITASWPLEVWTHGVFVAAFLLLGGCTGCYFPLAARQLEIAGIEIGKAGTSLNTADHLGAAVGAFLTGLFIVPVAGTQAATVFFVILLSTTLILTITRTWLSAHTSADIAVFCRYRPFRYILLGTGLCIIVWSNMIVRADSFLRPALPIPVVQALSEGLTIQPEEFTDPEGKQIDYVKLLGAEGNTAGFIFSTVQLSPNVKGFGGAFNLAVRTDTTGNILNLSIVTSNETPAYLQLLSHWWNTLKGKNLFGSNALLDVDAVTGATVSSEAFLQALRQSGQRFVALAENRQTGQATQNRLAFSVHLDKSAIYLITALVLVLIVTFYGGFYTRVFLLLATAVFGGLLLNVQYSTAQMINTLSGRFPLFNLSGVFLLAVIIPGIIIFTGNYYCGYICPFGAIQELTSFLIPNRLRPTLSKNLSDHARMIKYYLLFVFILLFFLCRRHEVISSDPLIEVFTRHWESLLIITAIIALGGSLVLPRFWCRYFCPAGAFLSLLNGINLLRHFMPPKKYANCPFGVSLQNRIDCICCDKCRFESILRPRLQPLATIRFASRLLNHVFLVVVIGIAVWFSSLSFQAFLQTLPASAALTNTCPAAGQVRDVDLNKVRILIRENRLSDHQADFYKKTD